MTACVSDVKLRLLPSVHRFICPALQPEATTSRPSFDLSFLLWFSFASP